MDPAELAAILSTLAAAGLGFAVGYRVARHGSRTERAMDRILDEPPAPLRAGGTNDVP
jgi:hypothetical protein